MSINFDDQRANRIGIPEVILAGSKENSDLQRVLIEVFQILERVLITRIRTDQTSLIFDFAKSLNLNVDIDRYNRTCILSKSKFEIELNETGVAIFSAGTSDAYLVEEINLTLKFMGWSAFRFEDIGVAGIHRHQKALKEIEANPHIKVIIVVAGQDGALFPVLTGQTKLPVVAVPSPVGYGYGEKGQAALMSALQSCSPGIATVNIDNGFGAAVFASKLLNIFNTSK